MQAPSQAIQNPLASSAFWSLQIHQPVLSFWLSTHPVIQVHIGNPQLGMHDLLPGLDQYLVSLAIQALAQDGLNSAIGAAGVTDAAGTAGGAAGRSAPPAGGTFAALQQPPAGWAGHPGATPRAAPASVPAWLQAAGGLGADGRSDMSDKRCLLDLLLASDAGPPPPLLSLEATAREVQDVLSHLPQPPGAADDHADLPAAGPAAAAADPAGGMAGAAFGTSDAAHSLPGAHAAPLLDAALFRFASAPAKQAGAEKAAAGGERAPSPDILIWPEAAPHMPDPAESWQI